MSEIIKAEIKRLVDLVNDQTKEILDYPDSIPLIELDLVKESLRRLYQHVNYLSAAYDQKIEAEPEVVIPSIPKVVEEAQLDETDVQAEALMNEAEAQLSEVREVASHDIEETLAEMEEAITEASKEEELVEEVLEKQDDYPVEEEQQVEDAPAHVSQIEEPSTVQESSASIKKSKKESKEEILIADQISKSTIKSLKTAIGINDKFQFINELFDGSLPKYNAFIKELDEADDKEVAQSALDAMQVEKKWDVENPAFTMLQDYFSRRF